MREMRLHRKFGLVFREEIKLNEEPCIFSYELKSKNSFYLYLTPTLKNVHLFQLGDSLSKSLEVARALLQVLAVGAGALAASERVLASAGEECSAKLLRVAGCQHCRGHSARPCRNYCLNVARG